MSENSENIGICDECGKRRDRPSIGCRYEVEHPCPDRAQRIVHAIEKDFSDRRGLSREWDSIDEDIKQDIRDRWAEIVRREME